MKFMISLFLAATAAAAAAADTATTVPAEFRMGIFSEECFEEYFSNQNFLHVPCFKLTLSKLLGFAIISGAFLLKAPQVFNILKSGSVEGISTFSCYLDVLAFQNGVMYNTLAG